MVGMNNHRIAQPSESNVKLTQVHTDKVDILKGLCIQSDTDKNEVASTVATSSDGDSDADSGLSSGNQTSLESRTKRRIQIGDGESAMFLAKLLVSIIIFCMKIESRMRSIFEDRFSFVNKTSCVGPDKKNLKDILPPRDRIKSDTKTS